MLDKMKEIPKEREMESKMVMMKGCQKGLQMESTLRACTQSLSSGALRPERIQRLCWM